MISIELYLKKIDEAPGLDNRELTLYILGDLPIQLFPSLIIINCTFHLPKRPQNNRMNVWFNYNVTERKRELNHTFIIIWGLGFIPIPQALDPGPKP